MTSPPGESFLFGIITSVRRVQAKWGYLSNSRRASIHLVARGYLGPQELVGASVVATLPSVLIPLHWVVNGR
jgi:hypothetical protein